MLQSILSSDDQERLLLSERDNKVKFIVWGINVPNHINHVASESLDTYAFEFCEIDLSVLQVLLLQNHGNLI